MHFLFKFFAVFVPHIILWKLHAVEKVVMILTRPEETYRKKPYWTVFLLRLSINPVKINLHSHYITGLISRVKYSREFGQFLK